MCLDWSDVELVGQDPMVYRKNIDVMFLPCNQRESLLSSTEDKIPEDCNFERDELMQYLGPIQMLIYSNTGRFQ